MKKFQFNTKSGVLKGIEEKPVKKGINWDRIIYFGALGIVIFSFSSYFIGKHLLVKAESEIIISKFDVNFTNDVIVTSYNVEEGDTVRAGDTLFFYKRQWNNNDGSSIQVKGNFNDYSKDTENWLIREKIGTTKEIRLLRAELSNIKKEKNALIADVKRLKKEVFLDIASPAEVRAAEDAIDKLDMDYAASAQEVYQNKLYLEELERRLLDMRALKTGMEEAEVKAFAAASDPSSYILPFVSPKSGMVSQIHTEPNEVAYRTYVIMDMIEFKDIRVNAYFRQADLKYLETGNIVNIEFPDGSKSKGIVDKIYLKTTNLPDRLYDTGSKSERRIRAVVIPLNVSDTQKWYQYYKINVLVSKPKYF